MKALATRIGIWWAGPRRKTSLTDLGALLIGALLTLALTGYTRMDLRQPAGLGGDHLFVVAYAKNYINGHGFRLNGHLGFPDVQDNLRFPSFDLSYRTWLWLEAQVFSNPFTVVHGLYIIGILAMFGFGYWALRRLGVRSWIAALGAVATVLTPYFAVRGFGHDFLAMSFSAPLGMTCALLIGASRPDADLKSFLKHPFTLATIVVVGCSGLYYAFYTLMFLAFAGAASALGQRRWFPLLAVIGMGTPLFLLLLFSGYGLDLPEVLSGRFAGPHRFAFEQVIYGLQIGTAAHSFQFIPKAANGLTVAIASVPSAFGGEAAGMEWPAAPLSLIILASPFVCALGYQASVARGAPSRDLRLIAVGALLITFGLLFGVSGGLGFLFNLFVSPEIRADERLMPFLTFAAVAILSVATEMAMTLDRRPLRYGVATVFALLIAVSVRPQFAVLSHHQAASLANPAVQQLQSSTLAMLRAKDKAGLRTVLEMPVAGWPEAPPIHELDPYQHMLPYLFDRRDSPTRWSYGANQAQPWFGRVLFSAGQVEGLADRVRALGFDSILVEKRGYDAAGLGALQAGLGTQIAVACRLYEDELMVLYALPGKGRC